MPFIRQSSYLLLLMIWEWMGPTSGFITLRPRGLRLYRFFLRLQHGQHISKWVPALSICA